MGFWGLAFLRLCPHEETVGEILRRHENSGAAGKGGGT